MRTQTRRRLSGSAIFTGSLVVGVVLGLGGSSLALWSDAEGVTGEIGPGYEYFAAGSPGSVERAADGEVPVTIDGVAVAGTLIEDGEFAAAIQVDSLSQGNKGLSYDLAAPDWGHGILGSAEVSIFWIEEPGECHMGAEPAVVPETVQGHSSTPVPAIYSTGDEVTTEFWCVQANLTDLPDEGDYTNVATVTATDPSGTEVSDEDDWSATVTTGMDPADEPDHTIYLNYVTFRPGDTP